MSKTMISFSKLAQALTQTKQTSSYLHLSVTVDLSRVEYGEAPRELKIVREGTVQGVE